MNANSVLQQFFTATDEAEVQRLQNDLILSVDEVIKGIIGRKLRVSFNHHGEARGADAGDAEGAQNVYGEALTRLLTCLQDLRQDSQNDPIHDWRGFAAKVTYNRVSDYFRRKYPLRHSLENKLRYLLDKQPGFALWQDDQDSWTCGYEIWRAQKRPVEKNRRYRQLLDDPQSLPNVKSAQQLTAAMATAIFDFIGGPLDFDDLLKMAIALLRIQEPKFHSRSQDDEEDMVVQLPDARPGQEQVLLLKEALQQVWLKIVTAPLRHRYAVLLNLRRADGGSALPLLELTGVAPMGRLAQALEMTPEQFAAIWNRLPLSDQEIAAMQGCERQQVINCRKSVRRQLEPLRDESGAPR